MRTVIFLVIITVIIFAGAILLDHRYHCTEKNRKWVDVGTVSTVVFHPAVGLGTRVTTEIRTQEYCLIVEGLVSCKMGSRVQQSNGMLYIDGTGHCEIF